MTRRVGNLQPCICADLSCQPGYIRPGGQPHKHLARKHAAV